VRSASPPWFRQSGRAPSPFGDVRLRRGYSWLQGTLESETGRLYLRYCPAAVDDPGAQDGSGGRPSSASFKIGERVMVEGNGHGGRPAGP